MPDWMIQLALVTVLGIIAYFLKTHKTQQDKRSDDQQERIDNLDRDLQQYKLQAANQFVLKDDFIRATSHMDRKLDKIYDEVIKLSKQSGAGDAS